MRESLPLKAGRLLSNTTFLTTTRLPFPHESFFAVFSLFLGHCNSGILLSLGRVRGCLETTTPKPTLGSEENYWRECLPQVSLHFSTYHTAAIIRYANQCHQVCFMATPEHLLAKISDKKGILATICLIAEYYEDTVIDEIPYQFRHENLLLRALDIISAQIPAEYMRSFSKNIRLPPTRLLLANNYERFIYLPQLDGHEWRLDTYSRQFDHPSLPFKLALANVHMLTYGQVIHVPALPHWHQRRIQSEFPHRLSLHSSS